MSNPNPFLTDIDPLVSGEGILDPLGLSTLGDRLADAVLPGLRARMSRPRFVTAMAVSAVVCEGLPDVGADGVTSPHVVFEWLFVEGLARRAVGQDTVNTPGSHKAQNVVKSGEPMRAAAYLRSPTVFGFHGIYKPFAIHAGAVDDEFNLRDQGYALVRAWEEEQGLPGFLERSVGGEAGRELKARLRNAVGEALSHGYTTMKPYWIGWDFFAKHLLPSAPGKHEAQALMALMRSSAEPLRAETVDLLRSVQRDPKEAESELVRAVVKPRALASLKAHVDAIDAYEALGTTIEAAFEFILYHSSLLRDRALTAEDFAKTREVQEFTRKVPTLVAACDRALAGHAVEVQHEFVTFSKSFGHLSTPTELFRAVLDHHAGVQEAKQPNGKRKWFEGSADDGVFVRPNYRVEKLSPLRDWNRPYRFTTVRSFCEDLRHAQA